jgi:hypothetical protein
MFRTKFKVLKLTKGNNSKIRTKRGYCSYALHIYPLRSIHLQSFMLISLKVLELCPGQDFSIRGNNSKTSVNRVMVLWHCTPPQCLYHSMKFKQIISKGCQVMLRTRQQTDRRTDKAPTICSPKIFSGSIKMAATAKLETSKPLVHFWNKFTQTFPWWQYK